MSKLTYNKIWLTPKQYPKGYESALIFDWDDTLFCTSVVNPSGVIKDVVLPRVVLDKIALLERSVFE